MSPDARSADPEPRIRDWVAALERRHRAALTTPEFLKAVRALSARYVERRSELSGRPALDSAGKRAAFAAFYAPLHFFTAREVVRSLHASDEPVDSMWDLGCGTGAASAAWAIDLPEPASVRGIDRDAWAIREAQWNWRALGVAGRARRGDVVESAEQLAAARGRFDRTAFLAGWSVNELGDAARARLLEALLALESRGARLLIIEPLARAATPWWNDWAAAFAQVGGRADQWKFDIQLPADLAHVDETAGFRRDGLTAKSLWRP